MTRREVLEEKCRCLFGAETDVEKCLEILKDAFWQAHNSGYCNAMANRLMSGHEDSQTEFWEMSCRLRYEVAELCEIYKNELDA